MSVPDEDLFGALLRSHSPETPLEEGLADRAADFCAALNRWRSYAVSHSVPELIWKLYRETGYYDYVGGLKGGLLRQANLRMLADRAAEYEKTNYRGLFRFLRFLEDLRKRDTDLSVARTLGASEDVVRIMSIHKSKGLEFPVVIVADIAKGFNQLDAGVPSCCTRSSASARGSSSARQSGGRCTTPCRIRPSARASLPRRRPRRCACSTSP